MRVECDYYAILGVEKAATDEEIKKAYRLLVRRYHPDAEGSVEALESFYEVQEAYEILSDPEKRNAYDKWRVAEGFDLKPAFQVRTTLSHKVLLTMDEEQMFYILIEVAPNHDLEVQKLPLNLCLVIDCSTSMKGTRLQQVKEATAYIIDHLDENDIFSLVTFNDRAEVIIPSAAGVDKNEAKVKLRAIRSSGGTEIFQGLLAGINEVERWRSPNLVNHIIILTDGHTYGDEEECLEWAQEAARRNVSITTLGIGPDWNDKLLDEIATLSDGASYYIDSPFKVNEVFREKIHALTNVFARQMKMAVRMGEGVHLKEAFRVSPAIARLRTEEGAFPIGALTQEAVETFLLEILLPPKLSGRHNVLQLEIQGKVLSTEKVRNRVSQSVSISFLQDMPKDWEVPSIIVTALGKLSIFKMQEKAMQDLEKGEIQKATQRLETMATCLLNLGETELAKAALLEAGRIAKTGLFSSEGRKKLKYGTRSLSILPREEEHD